MTEIGKPPFQMWIL